MLLIKGTGKQLKVVILNWLNNSSNFDKETIISFTFQLLKKNHSFVKD